MKSIKKQNFRLCSTTELWQLRLSKANWTNDGPSNGQQSHNNKSDLRLVGRIEYKAISNIDCVVTN